jgi:hypothetical protein
VTTFHINKNKPGKLNVLCFLTSGFRKIKNNNNSIQFFIFSVLHQQPDGQLQIQHRNNNKYNKITTSNNNTTLSISVLPQELDTPTA